MTSPVDVVCPSCRGAGFELRLLATEGVGTARCEGCNATYLILDSEDYWFDLIQERYPAVTRCACKGTSFALAITYEFRADGDVRSFVLVSTCGGCGKRASRLRTEIDYGETAALVAKPLTFCGNPKLLYDLRKWSLYVTSADIARVARALADLGCTFFARFHADGGWESRAIPIAELCETLERTTGGSVPYAWLYATMNSRPGGPEASSTAREEESFWKRHEVIRFGSPTHMMFKAADGWLHTLALANEYVDGGVVTPKSARFRELTDALLAHLTRSFVSWRGKGTFDNADEHLRIFGDRFRAKSTPRTRAR